MKAGQDSVRATHLRTLTNTRHDRTHQGQTRVQTKGLGGHAGLLGAAQALKRGGNSRDLVLQSAVCMVTSQCLQVALRASLEGDWRWSSSVVRLPMDVARPGCCRMRDGKRSAPAHLTWTKLGFVSSNKELSSHVSIQVGQVLAGRG